MDPDTGAVTVLLDNQAESHAAMKDSTAWYINTMLQNVVRNGTGTSARFDGMTIAGKTGTTTSRKDLYFVGYSAYYTAAVWSGFDQPERMSSGLQQQSAVTWKKVMSAIHEGLEGKSFPTPSAGTVTVPVCADSGLQATEACKHDARTGEGGRIINMTFVKGDEPTTFCEVHKDVEICLDAPFLDADGNPNGMYHLAGEFCPEESRRTVSILDITREGAAAAVTVRDNQFTTGHLEALGEAAYCDVHTTAQAPEPTEKPPIDPMDYTTWPGPEDYDNIEDYNRFNPFDESTWPENVNGSSSGQQTPPPTQTPVQPTETPSTSVQPSQAPATTEEPFVPAA